MSEHTIQFNDIDAHFDAIMKGHGQTVEVDGAVPTLDGFQEGQYSVLRSDGTLDSGWSPVDAGNNLVQLKKTEFHDGRPVTLLKQVTADAFEDTHRIAERAHSTSGQRVGKEMAKRILMIQHVMDKKRQDTYPYDHRDDLHVE